ncbi:MAG: excinuclease ABC subunit UvrC, partial [Nitrospinota bacterium]
PEEIEEIQLWLKEMAGRNVSIAIPKRGIKRELIGRAKENARVALKLEIEANRGRGNALEELQTLLNLGSTPQRIEAFDISTIGGGHEAVASMAVFISGRKDSGEYRRFRIHSVEGVDDYGMMREVLGRRFKGGENIPDLLVIDGGVGQLHIAEAVVHKQFGLNIPIVSIAKGEDRNNPKTDIVYTSGGEIVRFSPDSPAKKLLQAVRDEAHRFAIDYHRKLREKGAVVSALDEIEGVGKIRKKKLLASFGSVEGIRKAEAAEIMSALSVGTATAEKILSALQAPKLPYLVKEGQGWFG